MPRRLCHAALVLAALGSPAAFACDPKAVLAHLEQNVLGTLEAKDRQEALSILAQYCSEQSEAETVRAAVPVADAEGAAPASQHAAADEEPAQLFGIEFRKAEPDAKGYDRLKKRR